MTRDLKEKQIQKDYKGRSEIANALIMVANALEAGAAATSSVASSNISAGININRGARGLAPR